MEKEIKNKIIEFCGGLGNQMFIYALYKKLSLKFPVKADLTFYENNKLNRVFELEKRFDIKVDVATKEEIFKAKDNLPLKKYRKRLGLIKRNNIIENIFKYNKKLFDSNYNYYSGYWQDERYFEDIKDIIKKSFKFKCNENIIFKRKSVSILVRRKDFLTDKLLCDIANLEYFEKAIKTIKVKINNPVFYIFSDDLEWCKKNLKLEDEHYFIDTKNGMYLMSQCENNIIANSTFSWWSAWLNKNEDKIVICPKKYYNKSNNNKDNKTPYLEGWIKI